MNCTFIHLFHGIRVSKKLLDISFICEDSANHTEHIESSPTQMGVMFNTGHQAISNNSNINLDLNGIFSIIPERSDSKMLFDPSIKKFNLPSLFIQQSNVFCFRFEIIRQEGKSSPKLRGIVNYSPQFCWVLFPGLISGKEYDLIKKNIINIIQKFFSINDFKFQVGLLSDDKKGINCINCHKQPIARTS